MRLQPGWVETSRIRGCGADLFAHTSIPFGHPSILTPRWREGRRNGRGLTRLHGYYERWMRGFVFDVPFSLFPSFIFLLRNNPPPNPSGVLRGGGSVTSHYPRIEGLPFIFFPMPPVSTTTTFYKPASTRLLEKVGNASIRVLCPRWIPRSYTIPHAAPPPLNIAWRESIEGARTQSTRVQGHPLGAAN